MRAASIKTCNYNKQIIRKINAFKQGVSYTPEGARIFHSGVHLRHGLYVSDGSDVNFTSTKCGKNNILLKFNQMQNNFEKF